MNVWTALFSVLSFIAVAAPFLLVRGSEKDAVEIPEHQSAERIRQIRWAMDELELDAASGKIGIEDRDALRVELERELGQVLNQAPSSKGDFGGSLSQS